MKSHITDAFCSWTVRPNGASGTASLTLPAGVTVGDTGKLYVFNEQCNGDYKTDYASQLIEVEVDPTAVDDEAPTLAAGAKPPATAKPTRR